MRKSKPYQVPEHIWKACETEAKKRRKKTGDLVRWSDVLLEKLNKQFPA